MKVVFTPPALLEFSDAVAFYEMQHAGLGARFKHEVRSVIHRILEFPEAGQAARGMSGSLLCGRFPTKFFMHWKVIMS